MIELHDYKLIQYFKGENTLMISINIGEFNNVEIYIDCQDTIKDFINIINNPLWEDQNRITLTEFLEEIYNNEITSDPYSRGEK